MPAFPPDSEPQGVPVGDKALESQIYQIWLTVGEGAVVVSTSAHPSICGTELGLIKHLVDECMYTASR